MDGPWLRRRRDFRGVVGDPAPGRRDEPYDNFKPGCTYSGPKTFDSDYNDFYLLLDVQGGGVILQTVTPEPVTMSLLGFGLVAMGGASLRRRKR